MADWISIAVATLALIVSLLTWLRTHRASTYDVADELLTDIIKLTIERPEFRDPEGIAKALRNSDPTERYRYDAFATLVWNYLETLYDRYGARGLKKSPFFGALKSLGERHREWLYVADHIDYYPDKLLRLFQVR